MLELYSKILAWKQFKDSCSSNLPAFNLTYLYLPKTRVSKIEDAACFGFFIQLPVSFQCTGIYTSIEILSRNFDKGKHANCFGEFFFCCLVSVYCVTVEITSISKRSFSLQRFNTVMLRSRQQSYCSFSLIRSYLSPLITLIYLQYSRFHNQKPICCCSLRRRFIMRQFL